MFFGLTSPCTSAFLFARVVATSANNRSVVHFGRLVRGHVMDPATGAPADRRLQSTVVATTAIAADALAKAALVLGRSPPGVLATWLL